MKFSEIPAHEDAKKRLRDMADGDHIPHALLIHGPEGIGKMMIARAFAQYVHCENRTPEGDSCGRCPSCLQHQSFNHIDMHYVYPVLKKSGSNTVFCDDYAEEWQTFLRENPYMNFQNWLGLLNNLNGQPIIYGSESSAIIRKITFQSHHSRYKIMLMWLPERMQAACANKLLKMIEEPYPDTLFILVSNKAQDVLPTIFSRCQRVELKRLPDEVVADWLARQRGVDPAEAATLAHVAEGNILKADKLVSLGDETRKFLDLFIELMRLAYQRKVGALKKWSVSVAEMGREAEMRFLAYCQRLIRENFIYNLNVADLSYLNTAEGAFSSKFARFITSRNAPRLDEVLADALRDIAGNGNGKIVMFDLAVRVILLLR